MTGPSLRENRQSDAAVGIDSRKPSKTPINPVIAGSLSPVVATPVHAETRHEPLGESEALSGSAAGRTYLAMPAPRCWAPVRRLGTRRRAPRPRRPRREVGLGQT